MKSYTRLNGPWCSAYLQSDAGRARLRLAAFCALAPSGCALTTTTTSTHDVILTVQVTAASSFRPLIRPFACANCTIITINRLQGSSAASRSGLVSSPILKFVTLGNICCARKTTSTHHLHTKNGLGSFQRMQYNYRLPTPWKASLAFSNEAGTLHAGAYMPAVSYTCLPGPKVLTSGCACIPAPVNTSLPPPPPPPPLPQHQYMPAVSVAALLTD